MKYLKVLAILFLSISSTTSCEEDEVSYALQDISAPTNVAAKFDITQDDSGMVSVTPVAEGATNFQIYFGDMEEETPTDVSPGQIATHTYVEGEFVVRVVAIGATGLTSELSRVVNISFTAPTELSFTTEASSANPLEVTVAPTAVNATMYEVYFGYPEETEATVILEGETATHTYAEAGMYTVKVVAKSASVNTIEVTEDITVQSTILITPESLIGSWVMAPEAGSLGVGPAVGDTSWFAIDEAGITTRACYFDDTYVFRADGTFMNVLGAETWVEAWQGQDPEGCEAPVAPHDGSTNATFVVDGTAGTITLNGMGAFIGLAKAVNEGELPNVTTPESVTYTASLSEDNNTLNIYIEAGAGVFWQYKLIRSTMDTTSPIAGTWRMAPEAGSLGVGPAVGDTSWFAIDEAGVTARACYFDDTYRFGEDGSFMNTLGNETWIEGWQGASPDACGTPVAPHDGNTAATYNYDNANGMLTINGAGAYIGLPKAVNAGELPAVAVPDAITYNVTFSENNTVMNVYVESGSGVFWQYKLIKDIMEASPIAGTWVMAPEAGSLGVGPAVGDTSWFAIDEAGVSARACYFDDTYVFGNDGGFMNVLGNETWIEGWQGASPDACGAPVAPHDGSSAATYSYDDGNGTLTINGAGAYVGLPKAVNSGELPAVAVPDAIIYNVTLSENNTVMNVYVESGSGVFWQYKLIRQ